MNNFPVPEPDRRTKGKSRENINIVNTNNTKNNFIENTYPFKQYYNNQNENNTSIEKLDFEKPNNNMAIVKLKHI